MVYVTVNRFAIDADRIIKRYIEQDLQKVVIMRKNLMLILLSSVLLSSCGLGNNGSQVSSLLWNEEYRKVINVLGRDTAGLRVPDDVPFQYKVELRGYSNDILAEYYYYRAYTGLKKYKKAIVHIVKYLEKTGHDRPYFESRIALIDMCYVMFNHPEFSIKLLEESLIEDRRNSQLKVMLASLYEYEAYWGGGDWQKAIDLYDEIEASLDSGQRTLLNYWKSSIYGDSDKALSEITKSLEKSGYTNLEDLQRRAEIYERREDYEVAIEDYTRMIEVSGESYRAYYGRGNCYEVLGDTLSARIDRERAEHLQDSVLRERFVRDSTESSFSMRNRI